MGTLIVIYNWIVFASFKFLLYGLEVTDWLPFPVVHAICFLTLKQKTVNKIRRDSRGLIAASRKWKPKLCLNDRVNHTVLQLRRCWVEVSASSAASTSSKPAVSFLCSSSFKLQCWFWLSLQGWQVKEASLWFKTNPDSSSAMTNM